MSDLIDKDTRAQGRRMTLDSEEGRSTLGTKYLRYVLFYEKKIPVSTTCVLSIKGIRDGLLGWAFDCLACFPGTQSWQG